MKAEQAFALPFLNGVYVAVDALRGSYLIVDGPYCVSTKAEMQYCHNLHCTLLPPTGHARVVHTASEPRREEVESVSLDRTRAVERVFEEVCARPDADVILATSFDFHQLLNFPLQGVAQRFAERTRKPVCHVASHSLGGSWLEGYGLTCDALARAIALQPGGRRPDRVAIVGYLFDRNEPDHRGNLEELRRLLSAIGLDVCTTWLSGSGWKDLHDVGEASLILSFPYARGAARTLAQRLDIPCLEVELPLGLTATARWLLKVAEAVGRSAQAQGFVRREVAQAVDDTRAHVLRIISGNTARVLGNDPWLEAPLVELCEDLGLRVLPPEAPPESEALDCHELCFSPTLTSPRPRSVHIPFGYPNYVEHPVGSAPFFGFAGYRHLVDRIASAVLRFESSAQQGLPPDA